MISNVFGPLDRNIKVKKKNTGASGSSSVVRKAFHRVRGIRFATGREGEGKGGGTDERRGVRNSSRSPLRYATRGTHRLCLCNAD